MKFPEIKSFLKKIIILCFTITITQSQEQLDLCLTKINKNEFYFVRHGQTDHNIGIVADSLDLPLNSYGRQQSINILPCISSLPVKSVCFSPLLRAKETKNIIVAQLQATEYEIADLTECSFEDWKKMPILKEKGFEDAPISIQLFIQQVKNGMEKSLSQAGPVLIVAHGGIYYALCYLLQVASDSWMIDNCEPVKFYLDTDDQWKIKKLNSNRY